MKSTHLLLAIGLASSAGSLFADFTYNNFNDTTGLQLNGTALATSTGVLRLTSDNYWQAGSAFSTNTVSLASNASFSTYFQFQMTFAGGSSDEDGPGADGIVFTVQTNSNNVGTSGGGIGYQGIPNSLGVEFDTWDNGGTDPNGNHVGFDTGGTFDGTRTALVGDRMNNENIWNAWVDYNGATQSLELRLSEGQGNTVRPASPLLQANIDLLSELGSPNVFVGFTSATGAAYENQDILNWEFRQDYNPVTNPGGGGAVPEPSTYGLIGAAVLLGAAGLRRRIRRA